MCIYFDQLNEALVSKKVSAVERMQFIDKIVTEELSEQNTAKQLWEVLKYAVPDERYELFKSTAEEQLGHAWECKSMEKLISSTGK
jgi:hypothetical protein